MPGCSIQDLSSELFFMIMDHLPPPAQVNLACTCKRLAVASRGALERHQDFCRKYQTASDLDPSTVPLLLRSAFGQGDPIPAWHVRSFEVWRDRTIWSDWQMFELHTPLVPESVSKPPHFRVSKEDVRRYLYWFEEQLDENLESELIEKLLAQIESGHDGLLKALLFAKLERLDDRKFVTRSQAAGSCLTSLRILIAECIKKKASDDEREEKASRRPCDCDDCIAERDDGSQDAAMQDNESGWDRMLEGIEKRALHSQYPATPWLIGFCNIRKVAVGVASSTWMDDIRDVYHVEPCTFLFSHLLRLPSLHSIYFSKLFGGTSDYEGDLDTDEEDCKYEVLPARSSSVKHIFLHSCSGNFGEDQDDLWSGPRELLTMSFRFDGPEEFDYATSAANALARVQRGSLQSLMWYGYTDGHPRNILGDHCTVLDNEEFDRFKRLPAMKHMSVCVNDIELCIEHADTYNCLRHNSEEIRDDGDDQGNIYDEEDLGKFIVRRIVTIFPPTLETLILWDRPGDGIAEQIEQGLVKMIQSGPVNAGKDAGADVYTLSSQENLQHSIEFAEAPDEYDLVSGVHAGYRPGNWVFDPYFGRRIHPGSEAERYETLWKTMKSEREAYWAAQREVDP